MSSSAFLSAAALSVLLASAPLARAQAKPSSSTPAAQPATPAGQQAPAAKAKFVPLVKGVATIEMIEGASKKVGNDIVTQVKVKNTSSGSIGLLRVDILWYDKDLKLVTGASEVVRRAFLPSEVVDLTLKSPFKPNLYKSQFSFSHAGGTIKAKGVKKFTE
jgi:hypothetical protein